MSTLFPLYNNLSKDVKKRDITIKQKEEFMQKISEMQSVGDTNGFELLYVLIKVHYLQTQTPLELKVLNSKKELKNIEFNLDELPNDLKQILYKFVVLHSQKVNETL